MESGTEEGEGVLGLNGAGRADTSVPRANRVWPRLLLFPRLCSPFDPGSKGVFLYYLVTFYNPLGLEMILWVYRFCF